MSQLDKIARAVGKALKAAGMTRPATLTVVTQGVRAPGNLAGGRQAAETAVSARGIVITWKRQLLNASLVAVGDRVVMLLGALIAGGAVPKVGDKITIEGVTGRIVDIDRDPAGAGYNCLTRT